MPLYNSVLHLQPDHHMQLLLPQLKKDIVALQKATRLVRGKYSSQT